MSVISLQNKIIMVTGAAGFIGSNLCKKLLESIPGITILGVDNMNDYYDVDLKVDRLVDLYNYKDRFVFYRNDISNMHDLDSLFNQYKPEVVVNLAAQAGVRYSITNPDVYIQSNINGFYNILECCRKYHVEHLVFASSSSVYGSNKKVPYSTEDKVDNPVSLYAATKKSNELFAHAYSKLYKIPCTGLRFFTVYGPMGRPDMAYFKFANKMVKGEAIQVYNNGDMYRDFTYIDDIVTGVVKVMQKIPEVTEDGAAYKIYNIGNNSPSSLMNFINILEKSLISEGVIKRPAKKEFLPMQDGDVYQTYADVSELEKDFDFKPSTSLETGLRNFAKWFKEYNKKGKENG